MMLVRKLNHRGWNYFVTRRFVRCISKYPFDHDSSTYLYTRAYVPNLEHGFKPFPCQFSTMVGNVLVQARDMGKIQEELEDAINGRRLSDAWDLHEQHMKLEGFARKSVFTKFIAGLTESLELQWVDKAYGLVDKAFDEHKHKLLEKEILMYLALGLAKCGRPVPASTLVRKLVEMEQFPHVSAWSAIIGYMSEKSSGAYLAVELVLEIGYLFQDGRVDPRKKVNEPLLSMKPNITCFNLALAGCLMFGTTKKAEQLLEMMPRLNMKADVTLLIIMAHIYERNGRRDELRKLRRHVEEVHNVSNVQLRQFHNCLLSCHLKFGDLDSASNMVLEMLRKAKKAQNSLGVANLMFLTDKSTSKLQDKDISAKTLCPVKSYQSGNPVASERKMLSYEDFCRDRKFSKLDAEAKEVLDMLILQLQRQIELITTERGILMPTESTYVKLVKAFLDSGKIRELAEFLIKAEKEDSPASSDDSALVNVINACISLSLLDQAHDLLDEMRLAGIRTGSAVYNSLLKAYIKENRVDDVTSLVRDAKRAGIQMDASSYEALIQNRVLEKDTEGALNLFKEMKEAKLPRNVHKGVENPIKQDNESGFMSKLLQEIKEVQKVDCGVHDWNNTIHFFCRKRLMQDAEKALKKMLSLGHQPNAQTFHSMVTGYAAIGGKYIEVAELWGEMKSVAFSSGMEFDQELLDAVLYTFVRGGFFARANEVVEMMENGNMFIDKYKYRTLFLKYHKTAYKGKVPKFQTESQIKKREATLDFKNWVGLF